MAGYVLAAGSPSGGGPATGYSNMAPYVTTIPYTNGSLGYGAANGGNVSSKCEGEMTFTFTWNRSDPPPASVILKITSNTGWNGQGGSCSNGLGHAEVLTGPPFPGAPPYMGRSSGTKYEVVNNPGMTFNRKITPMANCGPGNTFVYVTMEVTPVMVTNTGTILTSGLDRAMIGQHVTSTVGAGAYPLTSRNWTFSGPVFYAGVDWGSPAPTKHQWLNYSGPSDTGSLKLFYVYEGMVYITVTATATFPDGTTKPVTGKGQISIEEPDWSFSAVPGHTVLNGPNTAPTSIEAANVYGMKFTYEVVTPADHTYWGTGLSALAQKCNTDKSQTLHLMIFPNTSSSGGWKLDNTFPYEGTDPAVASTPDRTESDSPEWELFTGTTYTTSVTINDEFRMFLIYQPPSYASQPVEWIPVGMIPWDWHTSGAISGGVWPAPSGDPTNEGVQDIPYGWFVWEGIFVNVG